MEAYKKTKTQTQIHTHTNTLTTYTIHITQANNIYTYKHNTHIHELTNSHHKQ